MNVFIIGGETRQEDAGERALLCRAGEILGQHLAPQHTLIVCSPMEDAIDPAVVRGAARKGAAAVVHVHHPDETFVEHKIEELQALVAPLEITRYKHPAPVSDTSDARRHAWLFCQLQALESCNLVVVVGAKTDGSASLILPIAMSRHLPILPFGFLGGAAADHLSRNRQALASAFGAKADLLDKEQGLAQVDEFVMRCGEPDIRPWMAGAPGFRFFISYPRARPAEADFVEAVLRRRGINVFRDEHHIGAGTDIKDGIERELMKRNVFIAIWCAEYACSPWCIDELELALDQVEAGRMHLWLLQVDGTRIVPRRARGRNFVKVTRETLESTVVKLLEALGNPGEASK